MRLRPGIVLISDPFLPDPNFSRSVVYLVEHNEHGSMGFVLNHPMPISLPDVVEVESSVQVDIPLYSGGPVGTDTLHVIHQLGDHVEDSKYVHNHIYWGGNFDQIKMLLTNRNANYRDFRFFVGYSGWGTGQLEEEIAQKSWIVFPSDEELMFHSNPEDMWAKFLEKKGGKYKLLQNSPLKPDWN